MPKLIPVDYDPFAEGPLSEPKPVDPIAANGYKLTPVDHDPFAVPEPPGPIETFGRGLAHGALGLVESAGLGTKWLGNRLGSKAVADTGEKMAQDWGGWAKEYEPPAEIAGKNVWDNPEILAKSSFWLYNIADMVPALAASMLPAAGTGKAIQVAGKALNWTPKVAARLIKLGQWTGSGVAGGGLEAAQTYKTVMEQGGSEEEAARSAEAMALGAGVLNALSTGKLLDTAGAGFKKRVLKHIGAGAWEGITEGFEEPTEVFSKYIGKFLSGEPLPENLKGQLLESLKEAATVAPIAGVTGIGGSVLGSGGAEQTPPPPPPPPDIQPQQPPPVAGGVIGPPQAVTPQPTPATPTSPVQLGRSAAVPIPPDAITRSAQNRQRIIDRTYLPAEDEIDRNNLIRQQYGLGGPLAATIPESKRQLLPEEGIPLEETPSGSRIAGRPSPEVLQPGPGDRGQEIYQPVSEQGGTEPGGQEAPSVITPEHIKALKGLGYDYDDIFLMQPRDADYIIQNGRTPDQVDTTRLENRAGQGVPETITPEPIPEQGAIDKAPEIEAQGQTGNLKNATVKWDNVNKLWENEDLRIEFELNAPGTATNPTQYWEAGIRHKGWAQESKRFKTRDEAEKWLDVYDLGKINKDSWGPGKEFLREMFGGSFNERIFDKATPGNSEKIKAAITDARKNGISNEFRSLFGGIDPEVAGTTPEAVSALAQKLGLDYKAQAEPKAKEPKASIHDYSNTQIKLPDEPANAIRSFAANIPDEEIYTDPNDDSYGRENEPHATVRYGLATDNPKDFEGAFNNIGPIKAKMGKVSIFETDKYDVVKVDLESPDLAKANKAVGDTVDLPGETHKDYKPHATIAYVKKGEGKKYVGNKSFEGQEITVDAIDLIDRKGNTHTLKLTPPPVSTEGAERSEKAAPAKPATPIPGKAWINEQQRPIYAVKQAKGKRNKGKVIVTLSQGKTVKIDESKIIEWPQAPGEAPATDQTRQAEQPTRIEAAILRTKPKESKVAILGGMIRSMGKIDPLNFKGEVKQWPLPARMLTKKGGLPIDIVEKGLKDEGWLKQDENLLELLRYDRNALKRGKIAGEQDTKTEFQKKEEAERLKEHEPEAPPGDASDYVQMPVDELPEGLTLTIIENRTPDGWDEYKVTKTKEGVTLKDGRTLKLEPWDTVEVLKSDLTEVEKKAEPEKKYINETPGAIEVKTPATLSLRQDNFGKQRPTPYVEAVKRKQDTLGLVVEDRQQPGLFGKKTDTAFSRRQMKPVDVQSPEFKKWFGDSKVVDADGKPLRIYHGTSEEFNEFYSPYDVYWFTQSRKYATHYAGSSEKAKIIPVYVRITNPIPSAKVHSEIFAAAKREGVRFVDMALKMGYDGDIDRKRNHFIAFSPTQIKSAISNTGAFSETDPRIQFSKRSEPVNNLVSKWDQKGVDAAIAETDQSIELLNLIVPEAQRNKGAGTDFLNDLLKLSDQTGKKIELLASEPGTAKAAAAEKLKDFYGHFGFEVVREEPDGSGYWMQRWPFNVVSAKDIQSLTDKEKNVLIRFVKSKQKISNPSNNDLANFLDDAISDGNLRNGYIDGIFNKIGGEPNALYNSQKRDTSQSKGRSFARRKLQEGLRAWGYRNTDTLFIKGLGLTKEEKAVRKIAEALGTDLYFFKTPDQELDLINGTVLPENPDIIYVNSNTPNPLIQVAGHEFVHFLKRIHPDLYNFLDDCLKRNVVDFKGYVEGLKRTQAEKTFTLETGREELYGDFTGDQWTKPEFWKKLNQENPSLTRRLADFIGSILEKIKRALKRYSPSSDKHFKDINYAQDVIAKVMSEAALRAEKAAGDGRPVTTKDGTPINYVGRDELGRAFGSYDHETGEISVRDDLPVAVSRFVAEHEAQHKKDAEYIKSGKWITGEIRANLFPGIKDPVGLIKTVLASLTPERIGFYVDRARGKDGMVEKGQVGGAMAGEPAFTKESKPATEPPMTSKTGPGDITTETKPQKPEGGIKETNWKDRAFKEYEEGREGRIDTGDDYRLSLVSKEEMEVYKKSNPQLRNNPKTVTIYRATKGESIGPGDWVYLREDLAKNHLENRKDAKIVSRSVSIEDIITASDDVEFVYSPKTPESPKGGTITIYRGVSSYNEGDNYYSTDKEWARQFTQSGRESEVKSARIDTAKIYRPDPLPSASSEKEFDQAIAEAKEKGYDAVWFDEGLNEPNSIFVINKKTLLPNPSRQAGKPGKEPAFSRRAKEDLEKDFDTRTLVTEEAPGLFASFKEWFGKGYIDKDMKANDRAFSNPYFLGKKYKSMETAVGIEIDASENRSKQLVDDYAGDLEESQRLMSKDKERSKQLQDLIWTWDGRQFPKRAVTTDWFIENEDGSLSVNPEHSEQVKTYLDRQEIDPKVRDAFLTIRKTLDKKFIDAQELMTLEKVDPTDIEEFRSEIKKIHNYFPHKRTGNAFIQIIDAKGDVVYREHFNSFNKFKNKPSQVRQRAKEWLRGQIEQGKLNGNISDYTVTYPKKLTKMPDEAFFSIPVEAMQQIVNAAGADLSRSRVEYEAERLYNKEGRTKEEAEKLAEKRLTADMGRALSSAVSDVFKSRGWGSHAIHRKGIPGFEKEDAFGTLFDYLSGYAGFKTKIERARAHHDNLKEINAKKTPEEWKYVSDYVKDMLANQDQTDRAVDTLRGLMFVKYLGFVPKSALVNLTQNIVMAAPVLSVHTKGAHRKIAKAMIDVRRALTSKSAWTGRAVTYPGLTEEEQRAISELHESGAALDIQLKELKGNIPGSGWGKYYKKAIDASSLMMGLAEKFNRTSTGLAAYRVAIENGKNHEEAIEFAKKIIYDSHFLYGKSNLPSFARGGKVRKYLRSGYTFRSFTHNYLLSISHLMTNQGREGKLAAVRSFRNIILMGGMASLPFFDALSQALLWAIGDDDDDAMTLLREPLPETWMKDLMTYGLPGLGGMDFSGSLSIEYPKNWSDIIGVPYAMYDDTKKMFQSFKSGQAFRGIGESPITPMSMRNAMRAVELLTSGQMSRSGADINEPGKAGARKITTKEAVQKGVLGIQPTSMSKGYSAYQAQQRAQSVISEKRKELADRYVNALKRKDAKKIQEVLRELDEWNRKAVEDGEPYKVINLKASIGSRMRAGIRKIPKAQRQKALNIYNQWK